MLSIHFVRQLGPRSAAHLPGGSAQIGRAGARLSVFGCAARPFGTVASSRLGQAADRGKKCPASRLGGYKSRCKLGASEQAGRVKTSPVHPTCSPPPPPSSPRVGCSSAANDMSSSALRPGRASANTVCQNLCVCAVRARARLILTHLASLRHRESAGVVPERQQQHERNQLCRSLCNT